MTVSNAIRARRSVRAFVPDPVSRDTVEQLLDIARWSPSGGNLQPWRVDIVMGAARERLVSTVQKAIADNPFADESEIAVYPANLTEPYRSRRFGVGEAMYEKLEIPRDDKLARLAHLARNFEFFGAPVGLFFSLDRRFDRGQWAHMGMFMQSLALAAHEGGLATCMQEAWTMRAKTVSTFLGLPDTHILYCGMALGKADCAARVNALEPTRAPLSEFATFHGE